MQWKCNTTSRDIFRIHALFFLSTDRSICGKIFVIIVILVKIALVLGFLYIFVCSLDFLSSAFRLLGGKLWRHKNPYYRHTILSVKHVYKALLYAIEHVWVVCFMSAPNRYRQGSRKSFRSARYPKQPSGSAHDRCSWHGVASKLLHHHLHRRRHGRSGKYVTP